MGVDEDELARLLDEFDLPPVDLPDADDFIEKDWDDTW